MTERKSRRVAAAEAAILRLAREIAPDVRLDGLASRDHWSCLLMVATDDEKRRFTEDDALLETMKVDAGKAGRTPTHLSVESQETVDRRYGGSWAQAWR